MQYNILNKEHPRLRSRFLLLLFFLCCLRHCNHALLEVLDLLLGSGTSLLGIGNLSLDFISDDAKADQ